MSSWLSTKATLTTIRAAYGIRVGQLARELNQDPRRILTWLREQNQPFTHPGAQLPAEVEGLVRKNFEAGWTSIIGTELKQFVERKG